MTLSPLQLEVRDCPATNLIPNPSVEMPTASGYRPVGWHAAHYGDNSGTFTYANTGLDGQRSLRIDMTARKSGSAEWYFDAVPVTPGQTYTFSDLYSANVATSATVGFRMSDGKFKYIGYYPTPAATAGTLTFNFTAPDKAVSAIVMHLIWAPGYLVTDGFSLTQGTTTPDTTAPTVAVTAPAANANVTGTIDLMADAADNVGVVGVRFFVDGNPIGSEDTTAPYQVSLDTTTLTNGNHSITAIARDAAGNSTTSAAVTMPVANTVPDTTAPTISVTAPAANANISGSVSLTADASDNVGVAGVQFLVDGNPIGSEDTSSPFEMSLDSTTLTNGNHTVTAIARDAAGNATTSAAVSFVIANTLPDTTAPMVSVTAPAASANVSGTINLTADASDNIGVVGVQFQVDGNTVGSEVASTPYQVSLDTTTLTDGNHSITAVARDAAGNSTTSAAVSFVVANTVPDTTAPTVSVTGPTANANVSGTINLTADASDNVGVVGVRFLVDNNQVGSEVSASPYQVSLDTATLTDGTHSITAIARDADGNSTTSVAVILTVANATQTQANLIRNSSVEDIGPNGDPVGWSRSSWGTNATTFTPTVAGTDGPSAVRVEMTSYTDGDAKWYFDPVTVISSTTYTFSDAYRSNRESKLVAQYRATDGTLSYAWVASLAANTDWTNASFQLTIPANAAALTIFHLIEGVGWLETDKFSLTKTTNGGGGGGSGLTSGMISLTFDDGWTSQLQNAIPVLQQANLPATFYIITRANQGGDSWEEVQNHSFETAVADGSPLDWKQLHSGTNTANFNYASVGIDGARSGRVDVTSYTSGDDAWYFQDVAVKPGAQYKVSHQYNSDVSTSVVVRFTMHNGNVTYVDKGSLAFTNGQWQTQTFTITPPANADAMTVIHRISAAGSLSIDNFSVKEVNPYSNPDYMTPAQVQSLTASGYEVGAHTMSHADLTALSSAGALAEVDGARADLANLGITAKTLAYPYGSYNTAIEQLVASDGFIGARTVNEGTNTKTTDRFALVHHEVDRTTTVADVQSWINTAVQTKTWLILTFHLIDNSTDFYGTTPQTFQQIVSAVVSSNLPSVTVADGLARL